LRDIDYRNHSFNKPYTPRNFTQDHCRCYDAITGDVKQCSYKGPCQLQGHCESQLVSQAFYDLVMDLAEDSSIDTATAWEIADRLFKRSIFQLGPASYFCDSEDPNGDGNVIINETNGCNPDSLFMRLLLADDTDGDLSNGTEHSDQIQRAFNCHEIGDHTWASNQEWEAACVQKTTYPQDDLDDICGEHINREVQCSSFAQPQSTIADVGNNFVSIEWEPTMGAQCYDVMRSPYSSSIGYIVLGTICSANFEGNMEFLDEDVANGYTYWYRIVPVAANSVCIGKMSSPTSIYPSGGLSILPNLSDHNDEILWVKDKYKSFSIKAYGGYGDYTYSYVGNLPTGLVLDENTGIISGTTSLAGTYSITLTAEDNNNPSLVGQRSYVIKVLSGSPGYLEMAAYLLPAAVNTEYDFDLGTGGGNGGYRLEIIEGHLPNGLYITTPTTADKYHIQGTPTQDSLGLYPITLSLSALNNFNNRVILERKLYLAVLNKVHLGNEALIVSPQIGTIVGGNAMQLMYKSLTSRVPGLHRLQFVPVPEPPNQQVCSDSVDSLEYSGALTFTELHAETGNYQYLIDAETPPLPEGEYYVRLRRPASGETVCADNTFSARPLGAVSNLNDYSLSILDTYTQDLLAATPTVSLPTHFNPAGLDFSQGNEIARYLFMTDQNSGDAGVVDMGTLSFLGTIDAQIGIGIDQRYRESDIAVDPSNEFAYVTHLTEGYFTGLPEPEDPVSGGVTVLDLTGESCEAGESWCPYDADADPDPSTDSPGAPVGITRLYTESDLLLPLNIEILNISRPNQSEYKAGEKYPGYYGFISGVGEIAVNCLDPKCDKYELLPRPARLGILDLNPMQCDINSASCESLTVNHDYWKDSQKILGPITLSSDAGFSLGNINRGLSFAVDRSSNPPQATVYAVNQEENRIYMIDYVYDPDTLSTHWVLRDTYLVTGDKPSDVSINTINDNGVTRTLAYVTNEEDGTVSVIDTATGSQAYPDLLLPLRTQSNYTVPTSLDTHVKNGKGYGYTTNREDDTVSVFDLVGNTFVRNIAVGNNPLRIKIQPDITTNVLFTTVLTTLSYANPTDFTTPSKQPTLIRDWERVHELQKTSSNSTAVLSNIDNFQNSVDKWITDEEVKTDVTQGVQLYRTVYLMNLP